MATVPITMDLIYQGIQTWKDSCFLEKVIPMITKKVIYEGRVQGVGFRYATKDLARGFDVLGTVRNLQDGTVELIIAGDDDEVVEYLRELREDSAVAHHITKVFEEEIAPLPDLKGFAIVK